MREAAIPPEAPGDPASSPPPASPGAPVPRPVGEASSGFRVPPTFGFDLSAPLMKTLAITFGPLG